MGKPQPSKFKRMPYLADMLLASEHTEFQSMAAPKF